jgi:hypothetical protein
MSIICGVWPWHDAGGVWCVRDTDSENDLSLST